MVYCALFYRMEMPLGAGSGFVWDDKGHIVTNYHVVRNAQSAQVTILRKALPQEPTATTTSRIQGSRSSNDSLPKTSYTSMRPGGTTDYKRSTYKARVIGVDPGKDIAVLKVDAPVFDLYPIELGKSDGLRVGQQALAIGNPFGLDHTLTAGIISGTGREVKSPTGRPISNVIQSDAAINPGNSGGPLLDAGGRVIGMNTAIYSPSGASAGIGFAIPIDSVKFIVETLIRDGRVVRPILGITFLESKQAKALGILKGVLVLEVPKTSPAFRAGMKGTRRTDSGLVEIGDIIIRIDNNDISTEADLFQALENCKPGDKVKVTVNRVEAVGPTRTDLALKEVTLMIELTASSDVAKMFPNQEKL
jgi:S1-C subfamily serine protease